MATPRSATSARSCEVRTLPPLSARRGQQMLASAAQELSMDARDGVRSEGLRQAGALTARRTRLGMSLDLDGPHRLSLSGRHARDGSLAFGVQAHDIMASGPQALTVAAARGHRKGIHTGLCPTKAGQAEREDHELHAICEQIGFKAAQKFSTVREAFRYLDADHDGKISRSEMHYFFRAYNFPDHTADRFFDRLDSEGTGEVQYSEFMKYVAPYIQPDPVMSFVNAASPECISEASTRTPSPLGCTSQPFDEATHPEIQAMLRAIGEKSREKFDHAREVFRCVDCNDDGRITREETRYLFNVFNLSAANADTVFDHLASLGSGDVNYHEFVRLLGPFLDLPGTAALMSQQSERSQSREGARAASNQSSRRPSISGSIKGNSSRKNFQARRLNPAETEKEMRDVMKSIGEKLPLNFKHVRDAFRPLDLSRNGKITLTEMRSFLRGFGWTHEVADRFFATLDEDCRGELDFNTFMAHFDAVLGPANVSAMRGELVSGVDAQLTHEVNQFASILSEKLLTKFSSARQALRTLDLSNDGKITSSDMKLFCRTMCMPVDAANKMFNVLRKEGADYVEYQDFLALFGPIDRPGGRWRTVQELKGSPRQPIWTIM